MDVQQLIGALTLLILANIVGIWRVTANQNRRFDDRFTKIQESFDEKFLKAERNVHDAFERVTSQFGQISIQITKILEGDIRELRYKIEKQETNLESYRTRVHDVIQRVQDVITRLTLLEQNIERRKDN